MMQAIKLNHDGTDLNGELYLPATPGRHPGILVAHSALGLSAHERTVATDLAALGYATLAIDMFGGEMNSSLEQAGGYFANLVAHPALLRSRMNAWLDCLKDTPDVDADRTATMGYCFGGMCVLELARSGAAVKATISFHGLLTTRSPAEAGAIQGEVAAWCGGQDPYAPQDQIDAFRTEMTTAQASCQITVFGDVQHSFTNPAADSMNRPGIAYDALANRVSWAGTVALLATVLSA